MSQSFKVVTLSPQNLDAGARAELASLGLAEESFPRRYKGLHRLYAIADGSDRLDAIPTSFLAYCAQRSRSVEADTCRSYAESLVAWLNYAQLNSKRIRESREIDIQEYRNSLCRKKIRGRELSAATINLRVGTVVRYLRWGALYNSFTTPFGKQLTRDPIFQRWKTNPEHRNPNNVSINLPKQNATHPVQISRAQLKQVYSNLGRPYDLMVRWAISTGLRRSEICRLTIMDLEQAIQSSYSRKIIEMQVLRKGGKLQRIYVLNELINETAWYMNTERNQQQSSGVQFLFINSAGRPIGRECLTKAYARACSRIGVKSHFHMLRHTFAISVLQILEDRAAKGAAISPIKVLQTMMGHASVETTDVYLRTMQITSPAVEDALGFLYGEV